MHASLWNSRHVVFVGRLFSPKLTSTMSLALRGAVLIRPRGKALVPILYRGFAAHPEKHHYDPDEDSTPRRKYIFGGAVLIAAGVALLSSVSRSLRSDSDETGFVSKLG